jgi:hypothetical protein
VCVHATMMIIIVAMSARESFCVLTCAPASAAAHQNNIGKISIS